jgi:putative glutamine amidotransferase
MAWRRPRIAVSAEDNGAAWKAFAEIITSCGGEPELLTPDSVSPLPAFSALLLLGGGDIHPSLFGRTLQAELRSLSLKRDRFELQLYRQARDQGLPILGVCRGMQVMVVGAGGSLHQPLPQAALHDKTPYGDSGHLIEVKAGTKLAQLIGSGDKFVNSAHHQAPDTPGSGMIASAMGSDGVIEAVEIPAQKFVLGVQWHPERMWQYRPEQKLLVATLVKEARGESGRIVKR